ncbi:anti-phage dCTP deaminase [Dyadobacter fanqingshengii]|uniref:dCMP deaminase family protein n=1 Tax=Dyadobacter fanqingshengii TaxID=2906443 RepID=A0A9X1P6Q5_9BACT|nr:anti-phage dCTP deaminase [Dyadobacter fanqingshengii]MCF0038699.1 dCMP deaminase family protein [Dyadobacter fanqingshengii]USJ34468.1 dCMP deaminase family protein [Dyadobacter fanqingshengii]
MRITFTGDYSDLQKKLKDLNGKWDESEPNRKVLRVQGSQMNWFETTGTLQFQGKPDLSKALENKVKFYLYPGEFEKGEDMAETLPSSTMETVNLETSSSGSSPSVQFLNDEFQNSEIIIGIVSAVGTEVDRVITPLKDRLIGFGYDVRTIRVSSLLPPINEPGQREYGRIKHYMMQGDTAREVSNNFGILACGSAKLISESRPASASKVAYIVNSLKHPDEVALLRKIYGAGFYLIGIHSDKKRRINYLTVDKGLTQVEASELIGIDEDEKVKHGQKTRDTFHLSDFYLNLGKNDDQVKNTISRFLELIFAHPYKNPTFDEFAMYMAFASSARSGDLSRQVGAVIAKGKQIIATGANEVPAAGGGHYWAEIDNETGEVNDFKGGKDYTRKEDPNTIEQNEIIESLRSSINSIEGIDTSLLDSIVEKLKNSRIKDITEFGRVVHAEMQAVLSCAKEGISCQGGTLYCTTFPCHNCAKHLLAAGIDRVIYVEPYDKSKAFDFHSEAITNEGNSSSLVSFEPFIGVGASRFLDFFSMRFGAGTKLKRKNSDGTTVDWQKETAKLRVVLLPESYLEIEKSAGQIFEKAVIGN